MQYQAHFHRLHRTEPVTPPTTDGALSDPRSEFQDLIVDVDYDPLASGRHAEFIDNARQALLQAFPEDEAWYPWRYTGAHECRTMPPRPALLTRPDSAAHLMAQVEVRRYPGLYGHDELAVLRVWSHWLSHYGCGRDWSLAGLMLPHDLIGTDADQVEVQIAGARALLALTERVEDTQALANEARHARHDRTQPFRANPVPLYPLSRAHSPLFNVSPRIETSFLTAIVDLCQYYLSGPVWACGAYAPTSYDTQGRVYERDLHWRTLALAEGATRRALVSQSYGELQTGPLWPRLQAAGFVEQDFGFDASLPPQWVPPLPATPEQQARTQELLDRVFAGLRASEAGAGA